ncbi:MAG: bifunctional UDP-N-acetylglucosamine diphosphorylase/glucosamine-1-phosphate N-acetyltransferase GlmU [Alphaproteobacteria bacterium]
MERAGIILAAGEGKRMKSARPKVMHLIGGRPMLGHVIAAMRGAGIARVIVVRSENADSVADYAASLGVESVLQVPQLGTGHAAGCAAAALRGFSGRLLINNGDMPLITEATLNAAFRAAERTGLAMVAFRAAEPGAYGRVLIDSDGYVDRIVEAKDATENVRASNLCNAGTFVADAKAFFGWTAKLKNNNAQNEFYLTDIPALARQEGVRCAVVEAEETEVIGVNTCVELAAAEARFQNRIRAKALESGARMTAPDTVYFSFDTQLEADVQVGASVVFGPGVSVRSGAEIRAFSHLEGCVVEQGAVVGPFARLRPGAAIGENARIGNFVEVKNSRIEKGAKANHLTYLGDASVGAGANIGAGTITCNYDGVQKHLTAIGPRAFIGSNACLVAPISVGEGAFVGAGSVLTRDVEPESLAVARPERKDVKGWAKRFRERRRGQKAEKET